MKKEKSSKVTKLNIPYHQVIDKDEPEVTDKGLVYMDEEKRKTTDSGFCEDEREEYYDHYQYANCPPAHEELDVVVACGKHSQMSEFNKSNPLPSEAAIKGTFQVTPTGGKYVVAPLNFTFMIPEMAVEDQACLIGITRWNNKESQSLQFQNSVTALSNIYELSPHGKKFRKAVTVKFPLNAKLSRVDEEQPPNMTTLMYSPTQGKERSQWRQITDSESESETGVKSWCMIGKYCYTSMDSFCKVVAVRKESSDYEDVDGNGIPTGSNGAGGEGDLNSNNNNNEDDPGEDGAAYEIGEYVAGYDLGEDGAAYESVDFRPSKKGVITTTLGPGTQVSQGTQHGQVWMAELCIEKVTEKWVNLAVLFKTSTDGVRQAGSSESFHIIDSQQIRRDSRPLKVILNLHNQSFRLSAGSTNVQTVQPGDNKVRYFLELSGSGDATCQLSINFQQAREQTSILARMASLCIQRSDVMATVLRMDDSWKEIQTMSSLKEESSRANNSYIRDPTNPAASQTTRKHDYDYITSGSVSDFAENDPEIIRSSGDGDQTADGQPIYQNHPAARTGTKGVTNIDDSTDPLYANLMDPKYVNVYHINEVQNLTINVQADDGGRPGECNEGVYANYDAIRAENQKSVKQSSPEFGRFLKIDVSMLLKGAVFDVITTKMLNQSYRLTPELVLDICHEDMEEFEMMAVIRDALIETGKQKMASKIEWEVQKERLRQKRERVADLLQVEEIRGELFSQGILSSKQKENMNVKQNNHQKSLYLIDEVILRLMEEKFKQFIDVLKQNELYDIVDMIVC